MSTITLPNIRVYSDVTMKISLKDGGVSVAWTSLSEISAVIYSEEQRAISGRCIVSVDAEDDTLLVCRFSGLKPQFLGLNRVIVRGVYMGRMKSYDKPAFNLVRWTSETEGSSLVSINQSVNVEIEVDDISSSILDEAVAAAIAAADAATDASESANDAAQNANDAAEAATEAAGRADSAGITSASASVDDNVGTPSVDVSLTGQRLNLSFHNLKGETGTVPDAVLYSPQTLSAEQQEQARTNIGAGTYSKPSTGIPASDLAAGVIPTVPTDMVKYTPQTLDDSQKAQARTNIGAGTYSKPSSGIPAGDLAPGVVPTIPTEVFIVTYGATTQDEILTAVDDGKMPICKYGNNLYVYAGESSANYSQFTSVLYETAYRIYVRNTTWGGGSYKIYSKPSGGIPAGDLASGVIPTKTSDLNNDSGFITSAPVSSVNGNTGAVTGLEETVNKVTALDANSTDTQYPSAKCVYDIIGDIETLLANL